MNQSLLQRNEAFLKRLNRVPIEPNPALMKQAEERAASVQNRIADAITDFAGSMWFVYIHIVWFGLWIGLGAEKYPYGLLTMIVSLEAIFLSTFVMISQNRADAKRQVVANLQWGRCRRRTARTSSCSSSRSRSSSSRRRSTRSRRASRAPTGKPAHRAPPIDRRTRL